MINLGTDSTTQMDQDDPPDYPTELVWPDAPNGSGWPENPDKPDGPYLPVMPVKFINLLVCLGRWASSTHLSRQARPPGRCGLSSLTDLIELSRLPDPYVSSGHPVCLGHWARPTRLGCWAYSTRLCRQVGSIRLDRMGSPTCHGCEVEWEEFQIPTFFRVFEFLLI